MEMCKNDDFDATLPKECDLSNGAYRRNEHTIMLIRNEGTACNNQLTIIIRVHINYAVA